MNAKNFSVAMGEIDNKYISETINYKPKGKVLSFHKWAVATCIAACMLLIVTTYITRTKDIKLQVYIGETLITENPISLSEIGRSIAVASDVTPLNVQFFFTGSEDTEITVNQGNIELRSSDSSDVISYEGTAHINCDCTVWWKIDNAEQGKTYNMQLKNKTQEFIISLKFDEKTNTWIVYGK